MHGRIVNSLLQLGSVTVRAVAGGQTNINASFSYIYTEVSQLHCCCAALLAVLDSAAFVCCVSFCSLVCVFVCVFVFVLFSFCFGFFFFSGSLE
jgi:hypothetical protein